MNQPKHKISYGTVQAAIWTNEITKKDGQTWKKSVAQIEKRYKNSAGEWASTTSFDANDLADLIMVAEDARRFLKKKSDEQEE